jgi:hypothetical protein
MFNDTVNSFSVNAANVFTVTENHDGLSIPFTVRLIFKGDRYGLNYAICHDKKEPLVEFYDTRYNHTKFGQFVSRYYLSTILQIPARQGLNLHGGIKQWSISSSTLKLVQDWLASAAQ